MKVQPFKCGPDYIDTKHHAMAVEEESVNLDSYMASGHTCGSCTPATGQRVMSADGRGDGVV